jgi:guanylate kinase
MPHQFGTEQFGVPNSSITNPKSEMNQTPSQLAPLIVVSGPSGVGKTTVVTRLVAESKLPLRRAITATTRGKRAGEEDDRDYHFWSAERFEQERDAGHLLEWAQVFAKDYYGTPKSEVEPYRVKGTGVVLVIDVQGAARVRGLDLEHLSVFIDTPSFEELEARLRGRGDTSEERIQRRLATAREEMAEAPKFHHRIVNRELSEAVRELERVIRERFHWGGLSPCSTS